MCRKRILELRTKHLDDIISGRKKREVREIRPNNEHRYIQLEGDYAVCDDKGNSIPIEYDAIRFESGERFAVVEIREAYTEIMVDESGQPLWYDYEGERYYRENVVYELGEVLQK